MLYAIFILLLIVFFPILSVVLGVGVVALVATYWWVILIIVALPVVIKVLDKPYQSSNANTKSNNPTPNSEIDSKEIRKPYAGDAIVVIGRVGYLKFHSDEPRSKDSWSSKNEHEMSNKELCDHFLGEEAANPDREKFLEESVKKYCPLGTLPYWKQPNYGK